MTCAAPPTPPPRWPPCTGLTVEHDERLRERYFGAWQGLTMAEVAEARPAEYARWQAGADVIGGDVETLDDLGKRVAEAFLAAADPAPPGGTVVVATHGAAARQGIGHLLGWRQEQLRTLRALQNCHWAELTHDQLPRVAGRVVQRRGVLRPPGAAAGLTAGTIGDQVTSEPP